MKKLVYIIILFVALSINVHVHALSDSEIEQKLSTLKSDTFLINYPVGSIYITTNSDESTVSKMKSKYGGTWEVYGDGRVLQSSTSASGTTGGSNSVKLTKEQLPTLSFSGTTNSTGSGYSFGYGASARTTSTDGNHTHPVYSPEGHTWASGYTCANGGCTNHSYVTNFVVTPDAVWPTQWYGDGTYNSLMAAYPNGDHYHNVVEYFMNSLSGVQAHTHTFTGTYTNNSQTNVNVQNKYITVYMYKRTA